MTAESSEEWSDDSYDDPDGDWRDGWRDEAFDDDEADEEPFDPLTSPPDGAEAWLPSDLANEQMVGFWTGEHEAIAAGFLHHVGGPRGAGWAAGGAVDQLPPGPMLAELAARAAEDDLTTLGESELIGFLCGNRRLASWAAAQEIEAVITLARRRAAQARDRKNPRLIDHVADELAAALRLAGRSASRLLDVAGGLARLDDIRAVLAAGIIDWPRATVFADELTALSDADARAVAAQILPRAGELTTGQLRAALRRAVLAVDPEAAVRRRRAARKDAAVHVWDEASGNCALAGRELSPAETITADHWLTAQARWLQARGVDGTVQELRAAVFVAVLNGRPITSLLPTLPVITPGTDTSGPGQGHGPAGDPAGSAPGAGAAADPTGPAGAVPPNVTGTVHLTLPLGTWLGQKDTPGEVFGYGPVDAETGRDLARWLAASPATRWCLTLTDSGGRAAGHACARHGPGAPPPTAGPPQPPEPPQPPQQPPHPPEPASGASPGMAQVATWLARLRPVFLETGACTHQREVPGYRPPAALRHLITIRQPTCGHPGCRRPANRCDLDHTIPYDQGGRTCECNLTPECRHAHQAKQVPGWRLDQPEPGVLVWSLPHGRSYVTRPDSYPV